ncbi:phage portal protein [Mycolicibacterium sp. Y3]
MFTVSGGGPSLTGVHVSEHAVLGLAAVHRCVSIIASGIASLPLRAVYETDGLTEVVPSWLDNPAGGLTKHELIELVLTHGLLWGNAYLAHIYSGAGSLLGVVPLHPSGVSIDIDKAGIKTYKVSLNDGTTRTFTDSMTPAGPYVITHVKAMGTDGIRGLSQLTLARNSAFGIGLAADRSAARLFNGGALMSAIAVFEDDITDEDVKTIKEGLDKKIAGESNAGEISFINRKVKITPWSIPNEDLQWLESRQFQKSEIATLFGIPDSLVGLSEKQTSWGSGIAEMHRALSTHTFKHWTSRIEGRFSLLLPHGQKADFDYHELLAPDPEASVGLLIEQYDAGVLTLNEVRRELNRPPLPGGDVVKPSATTAPAVVNEP